MLELVICMLYRCVRSLYIYHVAETNIQCVFAIIFSNHAPFGEDTGWPIDAMHIDHVTDDIHH